MATQALRKPENVKYGQETDIMHCRCLSPVFLSNFWISDSQNQRPSMEHPDV